MVGGKISKRPSHEPTQLQSDFLAQFYDTLSQTDHSKTVARHKVQSSRNSYHIFHSESIDPVIESPAGCSSAKRFVAGKEGGCKKSFADWIRSFVESCIIACAVSVPSCCAGLLQTSSRTGIPTSSAEAAFFNTCSLSRKHTMHSVQIYSVCTSVPLDDPPAQGTLKYCLIQLVWRSVSSCPVSNWGTCSSMDCFCEAEQARRNRNLLMSER